jgi:hypothetical protein
MSLHTLPGHRRTGRAGQLPLWLPFVPAKSGMEYGKMSGLTLGSP